MIGEPVVTDAPDVLQDLRTRLDAIDERLLDVLRARLECCLEIARVKRANDLPMMQNHRIGIVHERAARYAERHGLSREYLRALYDLVITESCRVEDEIIDAAGTSCGREEQPVENAPH